MIMFFIIYLQFFSLFLWSGCDFCHPCRRLLEYGTLQDHIDEILAQYDEEPKSGTCLLLSVINNIYFWSTCILKGETRAVMKNRVPEISPSYYEHNPQPLL